jgi:hypothetical protein
MLRGISQRTAVAITLLGVLLLSVGTCVLPTQQATHRCCMQMSMPCESVNASCCTARPQVPPATVTPAFAGFASLDVAAEFLPANDSSLSREVVIALVAPSQSPPPGISILRI